MEFLAILQRGLGGLAGAISLSIGREELEHDSAEGPDGIDRWRGTIRSAAMDARSHARSIGRVFGDQEGSPTFVLLAAPIESEEGESVGGVAMLCPWRGESDAERVRLNLRAALLVGSRALVPDRQPAASVQADEVARVLSRAGQYRSIHEFGFALTNAIKQRYDCGQAALGLVRGNTLRVVCVSGLDHVNERSPGIHHVQQSMCECLDAGEMIVQQEREQWAATADLQGGLLHARWRAAIGGDAIVSLPLIAGETAIGVVSLVRDASDPFRPEELAALQKLLSPLAAAIPLVQKSTRSLPSHARASVEQGIAWVTRRESWTRKAAIAASIVLALWLIFKPTMYRVAADATVVAANEVVVASSLDASVADVLVRSGDVVERGQVLIVLDASDHAVRREHLATEVRQASLRLRDAVASGDPSAAAIARAERDIYQTELDLVLTQIERAVMTAPVSGTVVGSELSALRGRLVPLGEPLLSIAEHGALELRIDVPERRVTDLTPGVDVRFASFARPEDAEILVLERVEPAATLRDGRPVFVAHGRLAEGEAWLRPGMEGIAMIDAGERPNWWVGLHHVIDYAHLNFWIR